MVIHMKVVSWKTLLTAVVIGGGGMSGDNSASGDATPSFGAGSGLCDLV